MELDLSRVLFLEVSTDIREEAFDEDLDWMDQVMDLDDDDDDVEECTCPGYCPIHDK